MQIPVLEGDADAQVYVLASGPYHRGDLNVEINGWVNLLCWHMRWHAQVKAWSVSRMQNNHVTVHSVIHHCTALNQHVSASIAYQAD